MKKISLAIHITIALGLLTTGYAPYLNPEHCGIVALAGYAFPLFLLLTAASLALAAFTCKKHLAVPVAALIAAYQPVTLYTPFHRQQQAPEGAMTIVSYNTHNWGTGEHDGNTTKEDKENSTQTVLRYLTETNADIICLQESSLGGKQQAAIDSTLGKAYQHHDTVLCANKAQLTIFTRYPIKRKELIQYESPGNGSAAFWLDIHGKEVIVVNNHLQSTGLSIEDRNQFADMVHGRNDTIKDISRNIFSKLLNATRIRVPQAQAVATFIRSHHYGPAGTPIIVCGDFNDIPQSYVHHTIADGLTDCYQATATGPGFSFSRYGMRVRIDNVLCTPDITPYNFRVDQTITASDHYPIIGKLLLAP